MKQLSCEMCGSTDLIKQDGVFICQTCGMKYSVEEAKKMMIEGTVEVAGTVKVDNSAFVEKYLSNARRAYSKEDWEEVEKYYNLVEQNSPNNMEAVFFSAYGKAMLAMTDSEYFKREQKFNVLNNSISVISDHYAATNENKQAVLNEIARAIMKMNTVTFVCNVNINYGVGSRNWQVNLIRTTTKTFVNELKEIYSLYHEEYVLDIIYMFEPKKSAETQTSSKMSSSSVAALIMAILGIVSAYFGVFTYGALGWIGLVLGIVSLVFSRKGSKLKGLAIIAMILGVVFGILGTFLSASMY